MVDAAERLSKRVRAAMGDHNNDDLPVTQCVINMRKEVVSLQAECERLREDAERYRWLRDQNEDPEVYLMSSPEELDDAVDTAMQETS